MKTYVEDQELDGYRLLAQLIVSQAVSDYRNLRRCERRKRLGEADTLRHHDKVIDLERFFVSKYGELLCYGRGNEILERLRKEFE